MKKIIMALNLLLCKLFGHKFRRASTDIVEIMPGGIYALFSEKWECKRCNEKTTTKSVSYV
jgi:hypothetical protein